MNLELFNRWYDTLPTQKQIKGVLHNKDGYCCLGWATEVVRGPNCWRWLTPSEYTASLSTLTGDMYMSPDDVDKAMGFDAVIMTTQANCYKQGVRHLEVQKISISSFLSTYNDAGYSFDFIRRLADTYIKKEA